MKLILNFIALALAFHFGKWCQYWGDVLCVEKFTGRSFKDVAIALRQYSPVDSFAECYNHEGILPSFCWFMIGVLAITTVGYLLEKYGTAKTNR